MSEHPLTPAIADLFEAVHETPSTPDERRGMAWALRAITEYPEVAEALDRMRYTQGGAVT